MKSLPTTSKKKRSKKLAVPAFTPLVKFSSVPIVLDGFDLDWTERFRSGVFCFYQGQLGISFKNVPPGLIWDVPRLYCGVDENVHKDVRDIGCRVTVYPGSFQPIIAPDEQVEVMAQLLNIAELVEGLLDAEAVEIDDTKCDEFRAKLNQAYDDFLLDYGLLNNTKSYYDSVWNDVRLEVYLSQLIDNAGNKADIFHERLNYPPQEINTQQFFEEDLNVRVSSAYSWCMGWYGGIKIDKMAIASGLSEDLVTDILLKLELAYRDWQGVSRNWWDLLGVSKSINSLYQLKEAYREKVKEFHPDTNPSPIAEHMTKLINGAYDEALAIVKTRQPELTLKKYEQVIKTQLFTGERSQYLAVCKTPAKLNNAKFPYAWCLMDCEAEAGVGGFNSQSAAKYCLQELEKRPGIWKGSDEEKAEAQKIVKFYQKG